LPSIAARPPEFNAVERGPAAQSGHSSICPRQLSTKKLKWKAEYADVRYLGRTASAKITSKDVT
jgi:hypothetical protein